MSAECKKCGEVPATAGYYPYCSWCHRAREDRWFVLYGGSIGFSIGFIAAGLFFTWCYTGSVLP